MRSRFGFSGWLASCAVIFVLLMSAGCAHHYYDPYDHDYHRWDSNERTYYNQWVIEAQIGPNRDYRHLSKDDQDRYWKWRQNHHDHDRDHDRDQDHHHDHDHH
ncbi:MAG TPA: hypothetical protein VH596_17305 [Terriglobales bacterium]|jgi:hypothetical protein